MHSSGLVVFGTWISQLWVEWLYLQYFVCIINTSLGSEYQPGPCMTPMTIGGIRWPSMARGWSHGSIASRPLMRPPGAIGRHRRPCMTHASFQCLVLYVSISIRRYTYKYNNFFELRNVYILTEFNSVKMS